VRVSTEWISLLVFSACYLLFVFFPGKRSWIACGGAAVLVLTGTLDWRIALLEKVNWNVMGLFFGTLILAEMFMLSRVPAMMAEWLVDRTASGRAAMLILCALAGAISAFVENVAVVLLLAPVALSLADKLKLRPVPLLIGIAVSSNLQGTATMIGDPPSMILAGYMRMSFFDFFIYKGRPGVFFAVEVGAVASLLVLAFLFRRHRDSVRLVAVERARSWVPTGLLLTLVTGLSLATAVDPDFAWFAGVFTLLLAAAGLLWFSRISRWGRLRDLGRSMDWDTTFFLIGVFILVGALSDSGWLTRLSAAIASVSGASLLSAFAAIVVLSVVVSGFVDNVPFLLAMIPVAQDVAGRMGVSAPLLLYGLLIGTCLGGNLTPIGASANVVTVGILKKRGHPVGFREFGLIGIPFTLAAVPAACAIVWWVWAP
jgi:Na+/H+ antiporter NhaD/arsenite permease-like protein